MMSLKKKMVAMMIAAGGFSCTAAWAASLSVVGLFKDKAIVSIDGGKPRTLSAGQTVQGVKLVAADSDQASFEVDGKRQTLGMGQSFAGGAATNTRPSVSLTADARGHFAATGALNGYPMTFLVDTGATAIAISAAEARRIGLDYRSGQAVNAGTAAGVVQAWRVKFNTVKVGSISVNQVDGMVVETGLNVPLLGMSFLNRMEMKRDGQTMTLTQRY
ncbi:MAG: TIGR02281 family clan AA aspartic protease [Thiobacillus sp.]|uniref:retropepsin-like aspartic protease family protein n=1 Tax=Thiobacillus sp. 63-78 TaxID=1895859 RepID=UPI001AC20BD7|nr:TIGR02281 family clan AA aspartic protease [Thiobacillus sp. 63-78]MBN8774513.1 TIGR02281 family clan AA aspartic protease [Thiobacillus sp.]